MFATYELSFIFSKVLLGLFNLKSITYEICSKHVDQHSCLNLTKFLNVNLTFASALKTTCKTIIEINKSKLSVC